MRVEALTWVGLSKGAPREEGVDNGARESKTHAQLGTGALTGLGLVVET